MPIPEFIYPMQGSLAGQSRAGIVTATGVGAFRWRDGAAWLEEAGANLHQNPRAAIDLKNWFAQNATIARVTDKPDLGATAVRVNTDGSAPAQGTYPSTPLGLGRVAAGTYRCAITAIGDGTVRTRTTILYTDSTRIDGDYTSYVLSDTPQRIITAPVTPTAGKTIDRLWIFVTTVEARVTTFWLSLAQIENMPYATSYIDGSLGPGYAWTGTAHDSVSTRAAASVVIPAAAFPASLAIRYSEDMGATWQVAYLTAPGSFGSYGSVSHSGGNLTIAPSSRSVLIGGVRGDDRTLTDSERARLEARSVWGWADLIPRPAGILRIGRDDGIGGIMRIGGA